MYTHLTMHDMPYTQVSVPFVELDQGPNAKAILRIEEEYAARFVWIVNPRMKIACLEFQQGCRDLHGCRSTNLHSRIYLLFHLGMVGRL
mmetsp:Transcript_16143/g.26624  ORF Transcript_16143/g.26624 Transcript_16143/m.26624 type:complete len:89 (-) Transcript_16143:524-790(-)